MTAQSVLRDERTLAVENRSYRLAYLVLTYGLLLIIMYRGFVRHETSWDLFALLFLGGAVATFYQGSQRVLSGRWGLASGAALVLAIIVGAVLAAVIR